MAGDSGARVVEDCLFRDNQALGAYGGGLLVGASAAVRGCTFSGNWSWAGGAALRNLDGDSVMERCIVANSLNRSAVAVSEGTLASNCNVFWNNEGGNAYNWSPDPTDFEADPPAQRALAGVDANDAAGLTAEVDVTAVLNDEVTGQGQQITPHELGDCPGDCRHRPASVRAFCPGMFT